MFCFFVNNEFKNFWSNKPGDIFADLTCSSMKWKREEVDLNFYPFVTNLPQDYNFDENKKLIILRVSSEMVEKLDENEQVVFDENGNPVMEEASVTTIDSEHEPVVYMAKGVIVKPC